MSSTSSGGRAARMRTGSLVFVALGVLTVIEYLATVAFGRGALVLLVATALGKAWLILDHFMHVRALRQQGSEA